MLGVVMLSVNDLGVIDLSIAMLDTAMNHGRVCQHDPFRGELRSWMF